MNPFDLQIQTTASDGKHTPAECVAMAKENGCRVVAITDHDTVAGVGEAVLAGKELGVRVIPGIEISIQEHGMHLLGLGVDVTYQPLLAAMARAAENRMAAAREMVRKFQEGGFAVDWEDVLRESAGSSVVTRPHIVAAIMRRSENKSKLEGIQTKHDFFQKYFTDTSPFYVRASTLSPEGAIRLVRDAKGLAVWSHPPIPDFIDDHAGLELFLRGLIPFGLDGLECFGSFLTEPDLAFLEETAVRYKLLKTGGSDFHERSPATDAPWPRSASTIGEFPTYGRSLHDIMPALDRAFLERGSIGG